MGYKSDVRTELAWQVVYDDEAVGLYAQRTDGECTQTYFGYDSVYISANIVADIDRLGWGVASNAES